MSQPVTRRSAVRALVLGSTASVVGILGLASGVHAKHKPEKQVERVSSRRLLRHEVEADRF